jgi:hypothetical protein
MYDTFDNTYQATIGIDFLSKVRSCDASFQAAKQFPGLTITVA